MNVDLQVAIYKAVKESRGGIMAFAAIYGHVYSTIQGKLSPSTAQAVLKFSEFEEALEFVVADGNTMFLDWICDLHGVTWQPKESDAEDAHEAMMDYLKEHSEALHLALTVDIKNLDKIPTYVKKQLLKEVRDIPKAANILASALVADLKEGEVRSVA